MIIIKFIYYRLFFLFQNTKSLFLLKSIIGKVNYLQELAEWKSRNFEIPTPQFIKNSIFLKHINSDVVWIETGTYRGTSTRFFADSCKHVYTIEPEIGFYEQTKKTLISEGYRNISFYLGTSENKLSEVLKEVEANKINFWLDGHYSGSGTFKGDIESPIVKELEVIELNLDRFSEVKIFIDDIREFTDKNPNYPTKNFLIEWANKNKFNWEIMFDMMILFK